ncbi:hypothetical protein DL96DRAFT_1456291, partial [Flagelloscypha sp. PMI_526]
VIYTRSAAVSYVAFGAVCTSLSVKVVKRLIKQERPAREEMKRSYGMPSTHSASLGYFAAWTSLACLFLPLHKSLPDHPYTRIIPPLLVLPATFVGVNSRMWLGHHTFNQVMAGVSYGIAFASIWYALWVNHLNVYGPWLEDLADGLLRIAGL